MRDNDSPHGVRPHGLTLEGRQKAVITGVEGSRVGQIGGYFHQGNITVSGDSTMNADMLAIGDNTKMVRALDYATVDGSVATIVSTLAAGNTYKVMAPGATPTFEFTEAGTIAFNTNLCNVAEFNVTAGDQSLEVTQTADGDVVTFTAAAKQADPIPPLPAEPTADDVNNAVDAAKFVDSTVKTMIGGDSTKYNAFKTWADGVTGGEAAVVKSAHAADSYLLGQTKLLANAPVSEIKTIAKTSDTALTLTFEIKDGANAVTVAQTAANYVKTLVQCNEKVDFGNGTKIDATVTVTINGQTLTAAVALPANKPAAFMKVAK